MFGKTVTQYLGFQKVVLALIVLAFLVRLALSMAGTPNSVARWISVTVVLLAGVVYYGVAVHTSGFGSYKQLYPLLLFQSLLGEGLVALAVVLAIFTGSQTTSTPRPSTAGAATARTGSMSWPISSSRPSSCPSSAGVSAPWSCW